jgi:hypothetical protein
MKSLNNKLIIYDSNCKVCSSSKSLLQKLTSIQENKIIAYKDISPALSTLVDPGKFRNGMALIDTSGNATLYGAAGVAHIFSSQYKAAAILFRSKTIQEIFGFFYKILAYNRYIIATPKSKFGCDCFPDKIEKYRIAYILLATLTAVVLTALFGASLRKFVPGATVFSAMGQMLLIAGTGWVIQILCAAALLKNKALDYVGHLGSIMVAGLLVLVPSILFYFISGMLVFYIPLISVFISSACMLYLHVKRVKFLGLSQAWTVSWFLFLQSTALFWLYIFYLKNAL